VATALERAARWIGSSDVIVEQVDPPEVRQKLIELVES